MKRLGYLSAALRVSTHLDVDCSGPRAHVLGVIGAFESLGWRVERYIVGDRLSARVVTNSEEVLERHFVIRFAADLARVGSGLINSWRAWHELRGRVDWVYERLASLQSLGWLFQRRGIPWILETNAVQFAEASTSRKAVVLRSLSRWLEIAAYRRCDVLVCITDSLKELIVREARIDPDKVIVIPNGVDVERFHALRHEPIRLSDTFTVGFVARLVPWQSLDLLLYAAAKLRDMGLAIHVVVVGDGPARREWEDLATSLDLAEQTHFVGQVSWQDVPRYIAGFDVGFAGHQPSVGASPMFMSPIKLYEYMAMGKPVVASAHADARALVEGKNTGFLFQSGDIDDLVCALSAAYKACDDLPAMGAAARRQIEEHHSWEARMSTLIEQAQAIIERRRSSAPPAADRCKVLGVQVTPMTIEQLNSHIVRIACANDKAIIAHQNLHSIYIQRQDAKMRRFYTRASYTFIDGMPLILAGRLIGLSLRRNQRITSVDWLPPLMTLAVQHELRVFALGSAPGVPERAAAILRVRFPGLQIATAHGYFDACQGSADNEALLARINAYQPHILLVGMGMPRQEHWIDDVFDRLNANVIMSTGACMDYVAGAIPTPPRWMGRVGLEWLHRLASEPSRLWQRYLIEPWFVLGLLLYDIRTRLLSLEKE
jgi:exopolysaccharide biosynthesis WecB/TagA/CpsF family protein